MSTLEPDTALTAWDQGDSVASGSQNSIPTQEKFSSQDNAVFKAVDDEEKELANWLENSMTKEQYKARKKALWNCYHLKHPKYDFDSEYRKYKKYIYDSSGTGCGGLGSGLGYEPLNHDLQSAVTATNSITYNVFNTVTFQALGTSGYWNNIEAFGDSGTPPKPEFSEFAVKRSQQLLDRMLTSKQRRYYHRNRYIDIRSPAYPDRLYRMPEYGKIMCFDSGVLTKRLCIYSLDKLPLADKLLTLKMLIETDEQEFLKIAIPHPVKEFSGTRDVVYTQNPRYTKIANAVTIYHLENEADDKEAVA